MAYHMPGNVIKGSRNCQTSQNRSEIVHQLEKAGLSNLYINDFHF